MDETRFPAHRFAQMANRYAGRQGISILRRVLSRDTFVRAWPVIDFAPDLYVSTFCGHESRVIHGGLEARVRHLRHSAVRIQQDDEKRCNTLGGAFLANDKIAGQRVICRHV